jgi:hypothetical protein
MSLNPSIIAQGRFTSDGNSKVLRLRQDVDRIEVINYTAGAQDAADLAFKFEWQRGLADASAFKWVKLGAVANDPVSFDVIATNGFSLIDSSGERLGVLQAVGGANEITAVSTAAIPVATNDGDNDLIAGDVVRIFSVTGAPQLNGLDFTVGHNTLSGTTFSLDYMSELAVAGTTAAWAKVNFDHQFYPRFRYVTKALRPGDVDGVAGSTKVTLSVKHGYTKGQKVIFSVPVEYGMTQLDGLVGTITAIDETLATGNTVTVDIDSSAFSAFAFPAAAKVPFSPAIMSPYGEDTAYARDNSLSDDAGTVYNDGHIGIKLFGGATGPAGDDGDVIYWVAYKSFSVDNE